MSLIVPDRVGGDPILKAVADILDPPTPDGVYFWYCSVPGCDGQPHDGIEYKHARASQHPPEGDWFVWFIKAGRGWGKTRSGAEWLVSRMARLNNTYWGLVAPTFDDGRDLMVEGESGMEFVLDRHKIKYNWNRSLGQLVLANGAQADLFTSQKPESLRGPNLSGAWCDEPATWIYPETTWDNLMFMCRIGEPQVVLTGTPKTTKFVKDRLEEADYVTTGSSHENRANLSEVWYRKVIAPKEGTRLGRQEIYAEILDDVEGALWSSAQLDYTRAPAPKRYGLIVVGVDPSVHDDPKSKKVDECGIVAVGKFKDHGYVIGDYSIKAAPEAWARRAIGVYHDLKADRIVAEKNNGGALVSTVVKLLDPRVRIKLVSASRGKISRAEPVAILMGDPTNEDTWARATMHHVTGADLSKVEEQMTTYVQGDKDSPDRMDAMVWAATDAMVAAGEGRGGLRYRR